MGLSSCDLNARCVFARGSSGKLTLAVLVTFFAVPAAGLRAGELPLNGEFSWTTGNPVLSPRQLADDFCYSVKDPSIVFDGKFWHLFCTIRGKNRSHRIEYIRFETWDRISEAFRAVLNLSDGYFCAPQVFWFKPHQTWYLVYQVIDPGRKPALQPAYSTNEEVGNPRGWSRPELLFETSPSNVERWIDFWIICDETTAYLFFTSLDGRLWSAETDRAQFPKGWSLPKVVLEADIFEAAHIYWLGEDSGFLCLVEAQAGSRRYYKAYWAHTLRSKWQPLADTWKKPFAGSENVVFHTARWADSISHGELLRASCDETIRVDPARLRFLFQGATQEDMAGKPYGQIPWRLGLLEPAS